jgi:hypothetical protein
MSDITSNITYTNIIDRFKSVNRKENFSFLLQGISISIILLIFAFLLFTLLEGIFHFDSIVRTIMFFLFLTISIGILVWCLIIPILRYLNILDNYNEEQIAVRVGNYFPSIKDRLLNAIQIYKIISNKYKYSSGLIESSLSNLKNEVADLNFSEIIDNKKTKNYFHFSAMSIILFGLLLFTSPDFFFDSFDRIVKFNQTFIPPAPFTFHIIPGNIEITKGDSVVIYVTITGEKQNQITMNTKLEEQKDFEQNFLNQDITGRFAFRLTNIRSSMEYYVESKGISSDIFKITVVDRPLIRNMRILLTFPSYTGLDPRYLEDNIGEIVALTGTRARIELSINKDIKDAKIIFSDTQSITMNINGKTLLSEIKLYKDNSYHFELTDEKGIKNTDQIEYRIKIIPDEYPSIIITEPGKNVDITEDMRLSMMMKIKDDYGFSKLKLGYKLIKTKFSLPQEDYNFIEIPLSSLKGPEIDVPYIWNLTKLNLAPEDVISYFVEVFDNDNVSGPKSTKSSDYFVRFPSLDEIFSKVDDIQKQAVQELDKTFESAKDLKKKVDEINQDLKKSKDNLDWQKKKKIEETLKRYEEVQKKIDQVSKNLDEMTKVMQENKLLSQETMEKYLDLQKAFSEINSQDLSQAMKKLQESMQTLNPETVKQALQNFTFNEESFRQGIERTLSLLKRIIIEQKTDEVLKRIDDLISKQEALKQEASKTNPNDNNKLSDLAKKQDELKKELEETRKELQDLEKKMQEFPDEMPVSDLQKIMQNLANQNTEMKMNQASSQMQAGQMQQAQKSQSQVMKDLNDLKNQMQNLKKNLTENQKQQVMNALKKALRELLEVSESEEELRNQSQSIDQYSPRNRELAQKQMNLQSDLMNIIDQLYNLSQKSFAITPKMGKSIGNALSKMNQATSGLSQRDNMSAARDQGEAMSSLNQSAMQMQNALNQMGQQGGSGMQSLLKALAEMAGQQQGINQGMGMFPLPGIGGQMTPQQQAQLGRMLAEQQAVKKSLDQLRDEANAYGGKEKILGDLDQVSKEMEEVIKEMKANNIDQTTIQKQERILSRLLDAQRSMRERDFEKKRKSDPGKDFIRSSPKDIDLNSIEGKNKLQRDLLKAIEEGYSKDYENLIKKYFEALQKVQLGNKNK